MRSLGASIVYAKVHFKFETLEYMLAKQAEEACRNVGMNADVAALKGRSTRTEPQPRSAGAVRYSS